MRQIWLIIPTFLQIRPLTVGARSAKKFLSGMALVLITGAGGVQATPFNISLDATLGGETVFGVAPPISVSATFRIDDAFQEDFVGQLDCTGGGGTGNCFESDMVGYDIAGISGLSLTVGSQTWTESDLFELVLGDGHSADMYFNGFLADGASLLGSFLAIDGEGAFGTSTVCGTPCFISDRLNVTDFSDFISFAFGDLTWTITEVRAVPEPGTLALFGIGLTGIVSARRRRKV